MFFKKKKKNEKPRTVEENMVYMASLGISLDKVMQYQETAKKIKDQKEAFNR